MKKILLLLMLAPLFSLAQKNFTSHIENGKYLGIMPIVDSSIEYTEIISVDSSLKKDELYGRAKRFFVDNYKSANDVIQLDDKENGEIDGKGIIEQYLYFGFIEPWDVSVRHTFKIFVKDGKYKYEISDFTYSTREVRDTYLYELPNSIKNQKRFITSVNKQLNDLIASLKLAMSKKIESSKADW